MKYGGMIRNPLYFNMKDGKWYFWNEVWTDLIGPYETQEDARAALKKYCVEELGT